MLRIELAQTELKASVLPTVGPLWPLFDFGGMNRLIIGQGFVLFVLLPVFGSYPRVHMDYSWQALGTKREAWNSKRVWLHARQMPFLLCYRLGPKGAFSFFVCFMKKYCFCIKPFSCCRQFSTHSVSSKSSALGRWLAYSH